LQKKKGKKKKADISVGEKSSPEVEVIEISKEAELFLSFTNEMLFPSNFAEILNGKDVTKNSTDSKPV